MSNLAVHYLPVHGRPTDLSLIREVSSKLVKYASPGKPDVNGLRAVWDLLDADGVLILRNVAMTNQTADVVADPVHTGRRHAREWLEQIQEFGYLDPKRVLIEGANEVPVWGDASPSICNDYNCVFADAMNAGGWRVTLGQINTGWPANTGTDTPSNWQPFDSMLRRADWDGNWIGLHEYFGTSGPRGLITGWWAYRYRHLIDYCRQNNLGHPPIVISELGLAKEFQRPDGSWGQNPTEGWMSNLDPQRYMGYLLDYAEDSARDGVIAATVFTTDGAQPWIGSFDTHGIHELWKASGKQRLGVKPVAPANDDHTLYVPIVVMDGPQVVTGDPHYGDDPPVETTPVGAIDPRVLQAILQVESGGKPFGADGGLTIRFEAHIFRDLLANDALFNQHFQVAETKPWAAQQWLRLTGGVLQPIHTGQQATEYQALERARSIDPAAAFNSLSMGIGQVMGFNAARLGYASAQAMFADYAKSEAAQIIGALNYVLSDAALVRAVRAKDWREIARLYNGSGSVDLYASRLQAAYEEMAA